MNDAAPMVPWSGRPTPIEAQAAVDQARRLFQRVLASWVCDVLALRRAGAMRPNWRPEAIEAPWSEAA